MSSVVLAGSSSGTITIAAPAAAGTNTITLPAATGTAITSATAAADVPKPTALSTASGSAPSYSARAWINFNGSGTAAIRASANVTSLTDNGTGDYTVNFATAMADTNYAPIYYNEGGFDVMRYQSSGTQATGSCQIRTGYISGTSLTQADLGTVCASFFS